MRQAEGILLLAVVLVWFLPAQVDQRAESTSVSPAEAEARFRSDVRLGLPKSGLTETSRYVLNRSEIAVPILLGEITDRLDRNVDPEFVTTATELIAYAADLRAIDGVADLIARDERRFAPYVKRTLDHAINRKRGFEVAFYAVENHPAIKLLIGEWVKSEMDFPQSEELLAKAILDRERYAIPRENNKVLLGLLTPELQQRLNQTVERVRRQERERPVK